MVDYISQNLWLLWLVIALLCLIIELGSGDFFVTCFAIGALCAMVVSMICVPIWLQIVIFALCAILSIFFIRPLLLRALHTKERTRASNVDALLGRIGIVEERITDEKSGYVKIDGDVWRAVTKSMTPIEVGQKVRILSMESIVITVEPYNE